MLQHVHQKITFGGTACIRCCTAFPPQNTFSGLHLHDAAAFPPKILKQLHLPDATAFPPKSTLMKLHPPAAVPPQSTFGGTTSN